MCVVLLMPMVALFSVLFVCWELPRVHSVGEAMQTMGYLMLPQAQTGTVAHSRAGAQAFQIPPGQQHALSEDGEVPTQQLGKVHIRAAQEQGDALLRGHIGEQLPGGLGGLLV